MQAVENGGAAEVLIFATASAVGHGDDTDADGWFTTIRKDPGNKKRGQVLSLRGNTEKEATLNCEINKSVSRDRGSGSRGKAQAFRKQRAAAAFPLSRQWHQEPVNLFAELEKTGQAIPNKNLRRALFFAELSQAAEHGVCQRGGLL